MRDMFYMKRKTPGPGEAQIISQVGDKKDILRPHPEGRLEKHLESLGIIWLLGIVCQSLYKKSLEYE